MAHHEQSITIPSNGHTLAATLCLPEGEGPFPSVVMIHGSGPVDRDENMPGQDLNVFNTIAHHLATIGIVSLRYDKRGCGESSGDYLATGHHDLVDDAVACYDALVQHESCDPTQSYLLGHSEGCIISPQVFTQRPEIAGLILLCPFLEDIETTLMKQAAKIQKDVEGPPGLLRPARKVFARFIGATVQSQRRLIHKLRTANPDIRRIRMQPVPGKALREMLALDPPRIFEDVDCPMLLIGGAKDIQCDPDDVHRIADIAKGFNTPHVIENLTHVLRYDEGDPTFLNMKELIKVPIEPVVLERITEWFNQRDSASLASQSPSG